MTDLENLLKRRIPVRMRELYVFTELCPALERWGDRPVKVSTQELAYLFSKSEVLLHPLADSAAITARGLLHFIGVGLKDGALSQVVPRGDDLSMKDVGLKPVLPSVAIASWGIPEKEARHLLSLCILTANKVSGHFTSHSSQSLEADIASLATAFTLVNRLIGREIYQTLGRPSPGFPEIAVASV